MRKKGENGREPVDLERASIARGLKGERVTDGHVGPFSVTILHAGCTRAGEVCEEFARREEEEF